MDNIYLLDLKMQFRNGPRYVKLNRMQLIGALQRAIADYERLEVERDMWKHKAYLRLKHPELSFMLAARIAKTI